MPESTSEAVPVGRPATSEETALLEWGQRSLQENLTLVNAVLRQQVALVAALLAAGIALFGKDVIPKGALKAVSIALLASLVVAFVGVMPYESDVDLNSPEDLRKHKESAYRFKRRVLWISGGLLALALGGAIGSLWAT